MTKWHEVFMMLSGILIFIGMHSKLQQVGIVDQYWWVLIMVGIFLIFYMSKKFNGPIPSPF